MKTTNSRFSRAIASKRRYSFKGEPIVILGEQDAPGFAFVTHADPARCTFFGLRLKVIAKLARA